MLKALKDNLYYIHAVDGRHYLGIMDDGYFTDPMEIMPERVTTEEGEERVRFRFAMTYMMEALCDMSRAAEQDRSTLGLKFEHAMAYAPANEQAADMYFKTKEELIKLRMEAAMKANAAAAEADAADADEEAGKKRKRKARVSSLDEETIKQ